jgi:hypothetical protein
VGFYPFAPVTAPPSGPAGGVLAGTYPNPGWAEAGPVGFTPANPTGTTSLTQVMMGLGSSCTYTPGSSGLVLVVVTFGFYTLTGATSVTLSGQYGTGAAPANGAAVTGTLFGGTAAETYGGTEFATGSRQMAFTAVLSLTAGTTYWFDVAVATTTGADEAVIQNVSMAFAELPS